MTDRNVQFPNRYQLTKVPGTDDIYDLTPAPGTITEEGTMINKASLLTDETAQAYGFTAEELAGVVPDEVFSAIKTLIDGAQNTANGRSRVETGSYVGTGTQGSGSPNSLTFGFSPKFLMVCGKDTASSYNYQTQLFYCEGITKQITWYYSRETSNTGNVEISVSGNTVSWYNPHNNGADFQLNKSGVTYKYVAIG